ncbi:MAG TPA: FtsQ-type POTRA domain-containing protein [Acidimicrobiales bacterium]|nr:FtsQ-type POTRA domain-containing protein [Acidimicrobiales bacterium]
MTDVLDPAPPSAPPPSIDPRFRRRWAEVRREEGRKRLRVLLGALGVLAVAAGGVGALHSPLLTVRHVEVLGGTETPAAEIVSAAGIVTGHTLMLDVGGAPAERALDALPWVGGVSFSRRWPWTVVITVQQRSPVALVPLARGGPELVDVTGRALEVLTPSERTPALPVLTGAQGALPGRRVLPAQPGGDAALDELLSAASTVPAKLAKQGLTLGAGPSAGEVTAYFGPTKVPVTLGNSSLMAYKMDVLLELSERVTLAGYWSVDLSVPERPALTPLPDAGNS